ncbi:MAG: hypothetical protein KAJ51_04480, partial [Thermoplasmata archaeon]|nr:hypothetical protein [Thermoplasmata archaeon]
MKYKRKNRIKSKNLISTLLIITIMLLVLLCNFTIVAGDDNNGNSFAYGHVKKAGKDNKPTFI